jgi:phosphate transport system substrate-binding protein
MKRWLVAIAVLAFTTASAKGDTVSKKPPARETLRATLDPGLPPYQPSRPVSGKIRVVGEDHMDELMKMWVEAFAKLQPALKLDVELEGSEEAVPVFTEGKADLALTGRSLLPYNELPAFVRKYGYPPFTLSVAGGTYRSEGKIHATAIIVNKVNPIERLSLSQLDAIFSKTRKRGYERDLTTWGQLGLKGEWAARPITVYSLKKRMGATNYLQERILEGGEYKDGIREFSSVSAGTVKGLDQVVGAVAQDPGGIGYASFAHANADVKAVALAEKDEGPYYRGTFEDVVSRRYPLTRVVYIILNRPPGKPIEPKVRDFLTFLLSREGQQVVQSEGNYLPLPAEIVKQERAKLE